MLASFFFSFHSMYFFCCSLVFTIHFCSLLSILCTVTGAVVQAVHRFSFIIFLFRFFFIFNRRLHIGFFLLCAVWKHRELAAHIQLTDVQSNWTCTNSSFAAGYYCTCTVWDPQQPKHSKFMWEKFNTWRRRRRRDLCVLVIFVYDAVILKCFGNSERGGEKYEMNDGAPSDGENDI